MSKILICCDSFKGTLSTFEVNKIIEDELKYAGFNCITLPMADGGEGSLDIIAFLKKKLQHVQTYTPDHRLINSIYYIDKNKAYIDIASSGGLSLVDPKNRKPLQLSTYGVGLIVRDAIDKGVKEIDLFLGGSATVDGGSGLLYGLVEAEIPSCNPLANFNINLFSSLNNLLKDIKVNIITDVDNVILGNNGAAAIFGPQKGASPSEVVILERYMFEWVELLQTYSNIKLNTIKGLGAAGGIALPFVTFSKTNLISGYEYFDSLLKYFDAIQNSNIVITGEGCIDNQTMMGKGPGQLAKEAKKQGKTVIGIGGMVKAKPAVFDKVFSTTTEGVFNLHLMDNVKERLKSTAKEVSNYLIRE
nr:glycerate kinase [uncultured Carboxylicivirga sp.]